MPRWSKAQETARWSIEGLASSELALNEVSHRTMAALRGAVGWDGYRLFGVDPQTLLIKGLIAASDNDDWVREEYLSEVYLAADPLNYIELPFLVRAKLPAVAFQDRQDQCWDTRQPSCLPSTRPTIHASSMSSGARSAAAFSLRSEEMDGGSRRCKHIDEIADHRFGRLMSPLCGPWQKLSATL